MRFLLTIVTVVIDLPYVSSGRSSLMTILDKTASDILEGKRAINEDGVCKIGLKNNTVGNNAYVTTQSNGTKLVLFRTWQSLESNLLGFLYTNGPPLIVGSEIEVLTGSLMEPNKEAAVAKQAVSIVSAISKTCYRVSPVLD